MLNSTLPGSLCVDCKIS